MHHSLDLSLRTSLLKPTLLFCLSILLSSACGPKASVPINQDGAFISGVSPECRLYGQTPAFESCLSGWAPESLISIKSVLKNFDLKGPWKSDVLHEVRFQAQFPHLIETDLNCIESKICKLEEPVKKPSHPKLK